MLNILSWNVQGLRSPNKRMQILRYLKKIKPDIALLQETNLRADTFFRLKKLWVGEVYGSPVKGKKEGGS